MDGKLKVLYDKLDEVHTVLASVNFGRDNMIDFGNHVVPFLQVDDLKSYPKVLMGKISKYEDFSLSEDDADKVENIIIALEQSKKNIPHLVSSSVTAISGFLISFNYISCVIDNIFSFEVLKDRKLLPSSMARRLDAVSLRLDDVDSQTTDIKKKITVIIDAYEAAESLPTTLKPLTDVKSQITKIQSVTSSSQSTINNMKTEISESLELAKLELNDIKEVCKEVNEETDKYLNSLKERAEGYLNKCEEAFRTTTTKGLAGAFEDKANKLNESIRYWVGGLVCALVAGAVVGYTRLQALEIYFSSPDASPFKMIIQILISFLGVGLPLWFAWLSTKQIGQRFRLAEDYEYKASISKAYEGYRKESIELDEGFRQRLFGNALTRLEEQPLRFVEDSAHSSPFMEILASDRFKKYIENGDSKIDALLEKLGLKRIGEKSSPPKVEEPEGTEN